MALAGSPPACSRGNRLSPPLLTFTKITDRSPTTYSEGLPRWPRLSTTGLCGPLPACAGPFVRLLLRDFRPSPSSSRAPCAAASSASPRRRPRTRGGRAPPYKLVDAPRSTSKRGPPRVFSSVLAPTSSSRASAPAREPPRVRLRDRSPVINPRIRLLLLSGFGQNYSNVGHDINYISIGGALGVMAAPAPPPPSP